MEEQVQRSSEAGEGSSVTTGNATKREVTKEVKGKQKEIQPAQEHTLPSQILAPPSSNDNSAAHPLTGRLLQHFVNKVNWLVFFIYLFI